jgi:hypothetical protein
MENTQKEKIHSDFMLNYIKLFKKFQINHKYIIIKKKKIKGDQRKKSILSKCEIITNKMKEPLTVIINKVNDLDLNINNMKEISKKIDKLIEKIDSNICKLEKL